MFQRVATVICFLSSVFSLPSSVLAPLHLSRTLYKSTLFMQNKPNVKDAQINVNSLVTIEYENISDWTLGQNKPNSKPISRTPKCTKNNLPDIPATPFCILLKIPYTLYSQIMAKRTMRVSWPDYQGLFRFATFTFMGLGG